LQPRQKRGQLSTVLACTLKSSLTVLPGSRNQYTEGEKHGCSVARILELP